MRSPLRDPGWLATLVVGVAALAVAGGILVARFSSTTENAVIHSEAWPWTADGVAVEPTAADSPFLAGDRVVAIDGRPFTAWVDGALGLAAPNPPVDDPISVDVIRDGLPVRLTVSLAPFPLERLRGAPLGVAAFGTLVFALALVLVWRRPRSTALRLLFLAAAANIADIVAWETGLEPLDFTRGGVVLLAFAVGSLFNLVFWSAIVHLLLVYPVRSAWLRRSSWLVPALYVAPIASFLILAALARATTGSTLVWVDRLAACLALVASAMLIVILGATVAGYRRSPPWVRRGVRLVAAALIAADLATLVLLTLPIVLTGATLVPRTFVSAFALIVPPALIVAVVRDRLFEVALLSRSRERIVAAREDERRRLRRDLHDGLAPTLAALGLRLDHVRQLVRAEPEAAEAGIDAARAEVRAVIADIRRMSRELRPPALDSLGLVGAVREQAAAVGAQASGPPAFVVDAPTALPPLPAAVEVAAYRIAVEAMMNVVRHASATTCRVEIRMEPDALDIEVADDGGGLDGGAGGVGLRSMRERAAEVGGDVVIVNGDQGGTRVLARLPVELSILAAAQS